MVFCLAWVALALLGIQEYMRSTSQSSETACSQSARWAAVEREKMTITTHFQIARVREPAVANWSRSEKAFRLGRMWGVKFGMGAVRVDDERAWGKVIRCLSVQGGGAL